LTVARRPSRGVDPPRSLLTGANHAEEQAGRASRNAALPADSHCAPAGSASYAGEDRPETSLLYRLIAAHYPAFRDRRAAETRPLPRYVEEEFEAYLRCDQKARDRPICRYEISLPRGKKGSRKLGDHLGWRPLSC